ncbi:hypothetical protein BDA99DRAFT_601039 [Phascolomyces articulosus]|uniref:CST complex subunit STN1 n=1 Tax=Phascolomyces articulosus TaxID=60185 RepID=A0AAD5PIZ8_9FUNG|nr:hypothetical protein BDA99DRAFT_601039 [Phascolomyces articulosus]
MTTTPTTTTSLLQSYTLDPLFSLPVKLFIHTLLSLSNFQNRRGHYLLNNAHVIREAEVCGLIVGIEQTYNMIIYTIDDTTGTLRCCKWKKDPSRNCKLFSLGTCILARGYIGDFLGQRQITVKHIDLIRDPNREILHDLQTVYLHETLYKKPFELSQDLEEHIQDIKGELVAARKESFWRGVVTASQNEIKEEENIEITEELFRDQLLAYLRETHLDHTFSYTTGMSREELLELAGQVYVKEYGHDHASNLGINAMFAEAMTVYLKKGLIIKLSGEGGLYMFVNDHDLRQLIYDIIHQKQQTLSISFGGIMQEYIIARVRKEKEIYMDLSRDKIVRCLEDMVQQSVLYMTRGKEYKVYA